jgi:hypothetical protein
MSNTETSRASNRRAFLTRALAGAAGATIAASTGHAALPGAVDPLIALGAEQQRIVSKLNAPGQIEDVSQAEHAELNAVEEQIEALVPISAAGAIVLVRYLNRVAPIAAIRKPVSKRVMSTLKSHSLPRRRIVGLTRKRSFAPDCWSC